MLLLKLTAVAQCNKEFITIAVVLNITVLIIDFIGSRIPFRVGISFASFAL